MGDKSIKFEEQITRVYPQQSLFSHIIGQIDDGNKGISGIEKSFDFELKKNNKPLKLTVDTDIQYLIREELKKSEEIFKNLGSAAILMDINSGEILLVAGKGHEKYQQVNGDYLPFDDVTVLSQALNEGNNQL